MSVFFADVNFYRNLFQTFYCFQFENEVDSVAEVKRLARCEVAQLFSTPFGRIFVACLFLWYDYFCGLIILVASLFLWPDYFL